MEQEKKSVIYPEPREKQFTITLNRETVMNIIVGAEFVLLLVFGWQLYGLKQELATNKGSIAAVPSAAAPAAPSAAAAPRGPVDIQLTADDHVRGSANAEVVIVEYSDFECPFCERAHPTVKQILDTYQDKVALVYRHFPLSFHPQAQKSAEASECAADQGKFWEFHDMVFDNQALLSGGVTQMKKWAGQLGLNQSRFDSCLDSGEKTAAVTADLQQGTADGVSGTPGFFINGVSVEGAQPFTVFQSIIDQQLAA